MARTGILAAGNFIRDLTRIIDEYPALDTLANILGIESNNGGAPYNVLKDLSKMGAGFPLYAIGMIGKDVTGNEILEDCRHHGIDIHGIEITGDAGTSFTDVMLEKGTGRRTFFHYRGANALLSPAQFHFDNYQARLFHLGYLMLLDTLDSFDLDGRTLASRMLESARRAGLQVSADLVSVNTGNFRDIITPSLPFIDYLFMNELEAEKLSGVKILKNGILDLSLAAEAADRILTLGVNTVVLHFPGGALARTLDQVYLQGSVRLPADRIAGTTGAGDAFAAGYLYGLHDNRDTGECLRIAVCVAASCLLHETCSGGILPLRECLALGDKFGFRELR